MKKLSFDYWCFAEEPFIQNGVMSNSFHLLYFRSIFGQNEDEDEYSFKDLI